MEKRYRSQKISKMKASTICVLLGVVAMVSMFSAQPFDEFEESGKRLQNREKFCKQRAKLAGRLCMIQKVGSGGNRNCAEEAKLALKKCVSKQTEGYSADWRLAGPSKFKE